MSSVGYLADDQLAIVNTQPIGYVPYYEYVYQKRAYQLPQDKHNIFSAMCMIYSLIKGKHRGVYGNTNFDEAFNAIFRGVGVLSFLNQNQQDKPLFPQYERKKYL